MKTLKYYKWGKVHDISFRLATYSENGNLYVGMISHDEGYAEPWSDLTVNLSVKCKPNCAYIDTNNNGEEIIDWLCSYGLATETGMMKISGWCIYPQIEFNMEKLLEYVEEDLR